MSNTTTTPAHDPTPVSPLPDLARYAALLPVQAEASMRRHIERGAEQLWKQAGRREFFTLASFYHLYPEWRQQHKDALAIAAAIDQQNREELDRMAQVLDVPHDPKGRIECFTTSTLYYATQGFGAGKYARCRANLALANTQASGAVAWLEVTDHEGVTHYTVLVQTTTVGRDIFERKNSGLSLPETVRRCWAEGCQPRVFFPFLRDGFEEQNGLNYFGGYLNAAGTGSADAAAAETVAAAA